MAQLFDAVVVLFYAITPPMPTIPGTEAITMNQQIWDVVRDEATEFLRSIGRMVSERGHRAEEIVDMVPTVDGILGATESQKAGLIVISTHGRSGVGRWIMGSVADAVIRRSSVPVLVVRPSQVAAKA
jgi:nucleotide-binding universal stress UspA family protein